MQRESANTEKCTLTHVCNNAFADSSTSKVGPVHGGLSKLGRAAIVEMNRLGNYQLKKQNS